MSEAGDESAAATVQPMKRARYLHPLAFYVGVFGRKERALKGWIAIGRDASPPELPPLDDPPRMKDWWTRHMSQRVPDEIAVLAIGAPAGAPIVPPPVVEPPASDAAAGPLFAAAAAAPPPVAPPAMPTPPVFAAHDVGYSGALRRLRDAEAAAGRLYVSLLSQAAETGRTAEERSSLSAEAERARRAWDELVNRLRPMEKDAAEILQAAGRMWSVDDVLASQDVIHLALKEGILGFVRRVRPKLRACANPDEEDKLWAAEVEKLFAGLRANKFTAPPDVYPAAA